MIKFVVDVMDKNYDVIIFILRNFILRKSSASIFAEMIIIVTIFIKTILKDSRKI